MNATIYNKTLLYVGIEPPQIDSVRFIHVPLIRTVPLPRSSHPVQKILTAIATTTHIIITSKTAASCFFDLAQVTNKTYISIGKKTTSRLEFLGAKNILTAHYETQEGVIDLIHTLNVTNPSFIWPHSTRSRATLIEFFQTHPCSLVASPLYETLFIQPEKPLPLDVVDGIFFSSPSTVHAFVAVHGFLPQDKLLVAQGPITQAAIDKFLITK